MKRFAPPEAVVFMLLESENYPMHIGGMQVFRPPEGAGAGFAREIYEAMRTYTDVETMFAGHPGRSRRGRSILRWDYEDEIDIDYHVRYRALPAPGSDRELMALVSRLHAGQLDRSKPLWEYYVIDGLSGGRFATFIKGHHALADGVSGARMSQQALSSDPSDDKIRAAWARCPQQRKGAAGADRRQALGPAKFVAHLRKSYPLIRAALRDRKLLPLRRAPRTIFNVTSDPSRSCQVKSFSVNRIRNVAVAAGVTFNDVALAMTAGALNTYLSNRDALPGAPLVAMVPVNIRDEEDTLGANIVGAALCNLATDIDDPVKRLDVIHASMKHNIKLIRALPKDVAIHLAGLINAPISGQRGLRRKIPPTYNLAISYVRGQDAPLYRRGALLEDLYGFLPVLRGTTLSVALFATSEHLDFGLAACAEAVPDLDVLTGALETALKDLERAVGL
jgi:diacylglycerol O-acyltransferase / wax synthase